MIIKIKNEVGLLLIVKMFMEGTLLLVALLADPAIRLFNPEHPVSIGATQWIMLVYASINLPITYYFHRYYG